LLESVGPAILKTARMMLGPSHPDLEDVVQESLLALVRALPSFRHECSVVHYAIRIAVRRASSARRQGRILGHSIDQAEQDGALVDLSLSPHEGVVAHRSRDAMRELLNELSEPQSEAIALRVLLGYSVEEVAQATAAPVNTVRSRLQLAKDALRRRILGDSRYEDLRRGSK
jgi:RNA polymerase sigma-70 factor (ECF subfamily)